MAALATISSSRRAVLSLAPALLALTGSPNDARAAAGKAFLDPSGRFALTIPEGFAQSKRTATTGTIFVAGNFPRAATVSVNAWPLQALVDEDAQLKSLPGMTATPKTLPAELGSLQAVEEALGGEESFAMMLLRKRDREASSGALSSVPLGKAQTVDGRLVWSSTTQLPVADPEALFAQRGVRELIRRTSAASYLGRVEGSPAIISICGSCLQQDWEELGPLIEQAVASFTMGA